jgi:hypothetical protein
MFMKGDGWIDVNDSKMGAEEYFKLLVIEFPLIRKSIEEEDPDMTHFRMERFANYTIEQIEAENLTELARCFDFQEEKIEVINSGLENALIVSYCESMLLGRVSGQMNDIVTRMPAKLKAKYIEYEDHYNKLGEASK